jgi:hypothetical protein
MLLNSFVVVKTAWPMLTAIRVARLLKGGLMHSAATELFLLLRRKIACDR